MESVQSRLKKAMDIRGMRQIDIMERGGFSSSTISQYLSGRNDPKQKAIYRLSEVLGVRPDWLMGLDVPMESGKTIDVSKEESNLIDSVRRLDSADLNKLEGFLAALLSSDKYAN